MPEIKSLTRQKPTSVVIDLGDGDTVNLVFDRNRVTPHWMDEAQRRATEDSDALALSKSLAEAIVSWDVTDDGAEFPPSPGNISVLSFSALRVLLEKVIEASMPSSEEGNGSSDISSSQTQSFSAPPASPQNGQGLSPSPTPSASPQPR